MTVRALVFSGYGINCQLELAHAVELAGAQADVRHARNWLEQPELIREYDWLLFPGGFSFGDELGAAKVFANKIQARLGLGKELQEFVARGGAVLGICNGFQLLVKLGLLPFSQDRQLTQRVSLLPNASGRFINRWVQHETLPSKCIFTEGLSDIYLPIRHGEGRFVSESPELTRQLFDRGQVVFRYQSDVNGSEERIAGICDETGRVLGMMAHPEAAVSFFTLPDWTRREPAAEGPGLRLFENAVRALSGVPVRVR